MPTKSFYGGVLALAGVCLVSASPASGQNNLALGEVLEIVKNEPDLVRQIEVELRRRDLKAAGMGCSAARHGSEWRLLAGGNAAPYECRIGDRTLRIDAMRTYFDVNGRKLGQVANELLLNKAKFFREGNFRWTWSP